MRTHTRRQRGFSIIELAVVMVILGLILTTAIPSIGTWMRNTKIRNQAEAVQNGLQQARLEAVKQNRAITFWLVNLPTANSMNDNCTLSATGTSWVVSQSSPASKCGTTPGSSTPQIVAKYTGADGGTGVSVQGLQSDFTTGASSVTFDGFGRASGNLRRINVTDASSATGSRPLRIDISQAGMIRMCDPSAGSSDPRKCL